MMNKNTAKNHRGRRILAGICIVLLVLVIAAGAAVLALFGPEVKSILSIKRQDGKNFYAMTYSGDYGFDDFLAAGGASSDSEVVEFVVDRILNGLPLEFELPELGCSTLYVEKEGGGYLFGRNFDLYDSPAMLVYTEPDDGYRSYAMVNLTFIGYDTENLPGGLISSINTLVGPYAPLDGMNEKGLCVSVMQINTSVTNQETDLPDITTTTAIRLILDKAATVDEAIALLEQYDMHSSAGSSYHFLVADAQGDCAVIEYIDDEMSIIDSHYATNFLLTKGGTDWRYAALEECYEDAGGVMTAEELTAVMKRVTQTGSVQTQWTCIYDQDELTVTVYYQGDFENGYTWSFE